MKATMLLLLAGILAAWPAQSQVYTWLSVDVPFNFYVGDRAMSAGSYKILQCGAPNIYQMTKMSDLADSVLFTGSINESPAYVGDKSELKFSKYDADHIFLRNVSRALSVSVALVRSRTEREHVTSRLISSTAPEVLVLPAQAQ